MIRVSRSWTRTKTRVPAWVRPMPMWCRRPAWRRVSFPNWSMRSVRTRLWVSVRLPGWLWGGLCRRWSGWPDGAFRGGVGGGCIRRGRRRVGFVVRSGCWRGVGRPPFFEGQQPPVRQRGELARAFFPIPARAITLAKPYGITAAMSSMAAVIPWSQSAESTKAPNVSRPTSAAIGRPMASTGLERFARNRLTS